jgi:AcrR family transcriptional regulator
MATSSTRRQTNQDPHPTATRLINSAVELLEDFSPEKLGLATVLKHSGVSHGSLYHHFEDFHDLVELAVVKRYIRRLSEVTPPIRSLLEARDKSEVRTLSEALFRQMITADRARNRRDQIEALGSLRNQPRIAARMEEAQRALIEERAAIFAEFQNRGWIRRDLDPSALAGFLQGMILGRVVDDVMDHHIDADEWEKVALTAFRAIFFGE